MQSAEVTIQTDDFDLATEYLALCSADKEGTGAVSTFTGLVREFGDAKGLTGMELEHYPGMTEKSILAVINEAKQRWPIIAVKVIHRVGQLSIGDQIVFVGVSSAHRSASFSACEFIMDYLKVKAPFWKKELTGENGTWVAAKSSDQGKASQWEQD